MTTENGNKFQHTADYFSDIFSFADVKDKKYRNLKINRQLSVATGEPSIEEWWEIHEDCEDANYEKYLQYIPHFDHCKSLIMYTFNDKIFPSQLNFIAAGG